jgi:hypothetical protein
LLVGSCLNRFDVWCRTPTSRSSIPTEIGCKILQAGREQYVGRPACGKRAFQKGFHGFFYQFPSTVTRWFHTTSLRGEKEIHYGLR